MSIIFCPQCGTSNVDQARFCSRCGGSLPQAALPAQPQQPPTPAAGMFNCPKCNTSLRQGAKFCPTCGYNIVAPTPQPVVPPVAPPVIPQTPAPVPIIPQTPVPPVVPQSPAPATPQQPPGTQLVPEGKPGGTTLVVRWMGGNTQQYPVSKTILSVGRAPGNDLVINHPSVSGRHLTLDLTPGRFMVTDLGSTNGTMLNGHRIQANAPQALNIADVLRIGDLNGNWVSLNMQVEGAEPMRALALGKLDLSNQERIMIGRDPSCYLPLNHPTVSFRHAEIYKQGGGTLAIRDLGSTNGTFVNGQRISQSPLKSGDVIQVGPFKLNYDAQQQSLAQSMRLGHRIDAVQLGREVSNKRMILQNVSLTVNPGEFVALVGGSGAGKSTLMKAMNGYEPANHGQILLDGEPLYSKLDMYRTQMGYVPQDDIIHRTLPVKLALWYAAKLRLPDAKPAEIEARIQDALRAVDMTEHANKPVHVLSGGQRKRVSIAVELLARPTLFFLDEPTSGLDPGLEKKMMYDLNRLADEGRTVVLVTHATANIEQCDHVAFMSYGRLAYYGPPNDALKFYGVRDFSDIYLKISQEVNPSKGKAAPPELQPYYPAYQSQGKVMSGVLWADYYQQSEYHQKYVVDRQSRLGAAARGSIGGVAPVRKARDNFLRQTLILARRQFDLIRLDLRTLFILLLMMPMIGALFMLVSQKDAFVGAPGTVEDVKDRLENELEDGDVGDKRDYTPTAKAEMLVTMLGLALTQGGTFGAAYEIIKERAIFRRERAVNLSVFAYVLSKVVVLAVFAIIQSASVLLVVALRVDMGFEGAVFDSGMLELFITLYLAVLASILFGLFISAVVPTSDIVMYAILVQLFVQIVMGGTLFPLKDALQNDALSTVLSRVTISSWVVDAMGSTVDMDALNNQGVACAIKEVDIPAMPGSAARTEIRTVCDTATRDLYLDYDHSEGHIFQMWFGLVVHCLAWFLLTYVVVLRQKGE